MIGSVPIQKITKKALRVSKAKELLKGNTVAKTAVGAAGLTKAVQMNIADFHGVHESELVEPT